MWHSPARHPGPLPNVLVIVEQKAAKDVDSQNLGEAKFEDSQGRSNVLIKECRLPGTGQRVGRRNQRLGPVCPAGAGGWGRRGRGRGRIPAGRLQSGCP